MLAAIPILLVCTAFFFGRPNAIKSSFIEPGRRYLRLVPMPFQYSDPKTTVEKATMRMPYHDMDTTESSVVAEDASTLGLSSPDPAFSRPSMASSAGTCAAAPVKIPGKYYKSQDKEDEMLMQWFGALCGGTYLELGGFDGVKHSNSYVFNKALGWKGVLIELKEGNYEKLLVNRPGEIAAINAGVCSRTQTLHEVTAQNRMAGGIWEFTAPSFREQWWKGITLDSPGVREIECNTLDNLLLKYAPYISVFDFLSLDVEGAELSVLESINYDRVQFGIVFVEADEHNQMKNFAMRKFLESKGYTFLFDYARSYWFVNDNFYEIYKGLVHQ
jgi:FkbM family methyltransferase